MKLKVGDSVLFYPVAGRRMYERATVREIVPNGIPSCREPMVMLEGKPGVVLEAWCKLVNPKPEGERQPVSSPSFGEYWIVEVSFKAGNPAHRAIGVYLDGDMWDLFNSGYDDVEQFYVPRREKMGGSLKLIRRININSAESREESAK